MSKNCVFLVVFQKKNFTYPFTPPFGGKIRPPPPLKKLAKKMTPPPSKIQVSYHSEKNPMPMYEENLTKCNNNIKIINMFEVETFTACTT